MYSFFTYMCVRDLWLHRGSNAQFDRTFVRNLKKITRSFDCLEFFSHKCTKTVIRPILNRLPKSHESLRRKKKNLNGRKLNRTYYKTRKEIEKNNSNKFHYQSKRLRWNKPQAAQEKNNGSDEEKPAQNLTSAGKKADKKRVCQLRKLSRIQARIQARIRTIDST